MMAKHQTPPKAPPVLAFRARKNPTGKGWVLELVACILLPNDSLLEPMSNAAGVWGSLTSFRNSVSHRPVSTLALIPHPQQRRVTGVHEVNDAHVGLGGVLAV